MRMRRLDPKPRPASGPAVVVVTGAACAAGLAACWWFYTAAIPWLCRRIGL
jgi:hypothetical protein